MRKILLVVVFTFLFYWLESLLFQLFGRIFVPHFLLLLVIFANLYFGIRYGLFAAVLAGLLKDSFGVGVFGMYTVSYILSSYFIVYIQRYFHRSGSAASHLLIVFLVCLFNIFVNSMIQLTQININFRHLFQYILFPQVLSTFIVATYTFRQLRKCARKLFA